MIVEQIYIATHKYDWNFAKICISSIRYWYPNVPIVLIKDKSAGNFKTKKVLKDWKLEEIDLGKQSWGWGYSKLLPLFYEKKASYLILDADTVMLGPVLDKVSEIDADFIVDYEIQERERFSEIYYNLDRINEIAPRFVSPGYSFNSGQVFGTHGILERKDFETTLLWGNPPRSRFPEIMPNNDQSQLNFHFHRLEEEGKLKINRIPLMIFPLNPSLPAFEIQIIQKKEAIYPYIMHWAGIKYKRISDLPFPEILIFYKDLYFCTAGPFARIWNDLLDYYWFYEKKIKENLKLRFKKLILQYGN